MNNSQIETKKQLESDGWKYLETRKITLNNRIYSAIVMTRNGALAIINHRGGFGGLTKAMAQN